MTAPAPFIVGVPRSGTTLLRLMVDAHPLVAIPPETGFIPHVIRAAAAARAGDPRRSFHDTVTRFPTWNDFRLAPGALFDALQEVEPFTVTEGLRAFYLTYARRHLKGRFGDKTPGYTRRIATIRSLLPEARFVHLIRDGRDVALSVRKLWFAPGHDMRTIARDWRARILRARRLAAGRDDYLEVRYESLIADPAGVLRRICAHADLPYDSRMERHHEVAAGRLDELQAQARPGGGIVTKEDRRLAQRLAAHPPDPSRIHAWKLEMPRQARAEFEAEAGDLLEELGYETTGRLRIGRRLRRLALALRRPRRTTRGSVSDP